MQVKLEKLAYQMKLLGVFKIFRVSKEKDLPRMMSIQNPYSLLNRTYEVGLAEISIRDEIGLLSIFTFSKWIFTGKYRNNQFQKIQMREIFGQR
jgi:aryl-alcohol dehydrogenase-like predicted oxidoreductase